MRRILTISVYMEDKCTWKIKLLSDILFFAGLWILIQVVWEAGYDYKCKGKISN